MKRLMHKARLLICFCWPAAATAIQLVVAWHDRQPLSRRRLLRRASSHPRRWPSRLGTGASRLPHP